jgi:pullulanase/glycogen debranching enzyme
LSEVLFFLQLAEGLAVLVMGMLLWIVDSLVRYVEEFHIDGFRFDLANCLCRGEQDEGL